jgi:hypothetical protein
MKSSILAVTFVCACHPAPPTAPSPRAVPTAGCAEIDPSFSNLVVTGHWRGHDVSVLVDTGSNQGSLGASLTTDLTPRLGETVHFAGASGQVQEGKVYDIDGLAIGGVTLTPFHAHTDAIADGSGYQFSIGLEHLAPYVVDFDVDAGWFCLRDRLPEPLPLQPMRLAHEPTGGKAVMVDGTFAGKRVESLILDTGSGVSTINEDVAAGFPHKALGAKEESLDGSGVRKIERFIQVASLCVLGVCAPRQVLMPGDDLTPVVGYKQLGIIGIPFLRGHRVILDFPHQQIAII